VEESAGFRPRVHTLESYLLVVVYSLLKKWSVEDTAERLNRQATRWFHKRYKRYPKIFRDGRRRRFYPHQTSVNALLERLSPEFVEETFQEFFVAQLVQAIETGLVSPNVRLLVDNTRYAYYGDERDEYTMRYHKFLGTDVGRFYQGSLVVTSGVALFLRFSSLKRGESRVAKICGDVEALQDHGISVLRALFDREFYRTRLVRDLTTLGVPVIMPAKQFKGVRRRYRQFLRGRAGLVQPYNLAQTARRYPTQQAARMSLVIIGRHDLDPRDVRATHLPTPAGERDAMKDLRAFLTTARPWKNARAFTAYLLREYKIRWRVECAFRDLNKFAPNWRTNSRSARAFYFGVSAALYNVWQLRAKTRAKRANVLVPKKQALVQEEMNREIGRLFKALQRERGNLWEDNCWAAYGFEEKLYA
jgi:hypothetical protein